MSINDLRLRRKPIVNNMNGPTFGDASANAAPSSGGTYVGTFNVTADYQ